MKKYFIFGLIFIAIYHSPYFILQKNASIVPNYDCLEMIPLFKAIKGKYLFSSNTTRLCHFGNGVLRFAFPSEFSIVTLLFVFADEFWAWVIMSFFLSFVAFVGTFLFFCDYGLTLALKLLEVFRIRDSRIQISDKNNNNISLISFVVSVYSSLIPYWTFGGISIAGQPLLLWVLLNILFNKKNRISWILLLIYPFFSNFYFNDLFLILVIFPTFILYQIYKKKIILRINLALLIFIIISCFINYRLFLSMLIEKIPTQRFSFSGDYRDLTLWEHIKETLLFIWVNKYGYFSYFRPSFSRTDAEFILILFVFYFLYLVFIAKSYRLGLLLLMMLFIPYLVITSFTNTGLIKTLLSNLFPFFKNVILQMNFRLYNLSLLSISIQFFLLLFFFNEKFKNQIYFYIILFVNTFYQLTMTKDADKANNPFYINYISKVYPSFNFYLDKSLFTKIKHNIYKKYNLDESKYTTITLVSNYFEPIVTQLNNFNTMDAYISFSDFTSYNNYEKIYNITKSFAFKRYFFYPLNNEFNLDKELLKRHMSCKYKMLFVFSTKPFSSQTLTYEGLYIGSHWKIYLYSMRL